MIYPMTRDCHVFQRTRGCRLSLEDDRVTEPITGLRSPCFARPSRSTGPTASRSGSAFRRFAQCPIFLDWARQEAAGSRPKLPPRRASPLPRPRGRPPSSPRLPRSAAERLRPRRGPLPRTPQTGFGLWVSKGTERTVASWLSPPRLELSGAGDDGLHDGPAWPTHPDWRSRSPGQLPGCARRDRNNNQPLLLAALGVAVVMLALISSAWTGKSGGLGATRAPAVAHRGQSGASPSATDTPVPTPAPDRPCCSTRSGATRGQN